MALCREYSDLADIGNRCGIFASFLVLSVLPFNLPFDMALCVPFSATAFPFSWLLAPVTPQGQHMLVYKE